MKRFATNTLTKNIAGLGLAASIVFGPAALAQEVRDPIEPVNRAVYQFNDTLDRALLKPVAQGYRAVLPEPVRDGVNNFFSNLRDPWIGLNQMLQGKVHDGFSDWMRFVTNTTFGLLGIFDVASEGGIPKHDEDFGQTLGVWGFDSGAYLVLPFFGPSSVRDGSGRVVDSIGYLPWKGPDYLNFEDEVAWRNALVAADVINTRANLLEASNILEEAALDRYAFVRDAYLQRRRSQVYDGKPPAAKSTEVDDLQPEGLRIALPQATSRAMEPAIVPEVLMPATLPLAALGQDERL
jgi:phospholipid-binding lipoprotein MlaA